MGISDDCTLGEARDWLRERVHAGERCPCCTQFAKVYKRALPNATCRVLIALDRHAEGPDAYVHLPPILDTMKGTPHQGGYGTIGQYWGLMEPMRAERDDGSSRVGWWKLTELGRLFVRGNATVPKYALMYDGRCLGHDGEQWTIRDALGSRFNYDELMERT